MKTKFTYTGIRVKNLERSVEFYTKLLGMKVKSRTKIEATKGEVVGLVNDTDGFVLELNYYEKGSPYRTKFTVGEALDHLAFQVPSLDDALREAKESGYPNRVIIKTEQSRWAYIRDPDGIWIELFE